ncbi:hydrogenase 2 operon protein HybA [Sedimenticola hydrogenitrophicus]|uniref:hydrogenase 2 operon protein HybA n=1 Tax=Sedimenticola hydrogenitrophicus TaxID=2967975 RepID=UPI0023B1C6B7|nr:hydrogenase 2 operon protein HybA [Sedimenticola hydrogenitrophicus]
MKRRDFLKATAGGATAALCGIGTAEARENKEPLENAIGILYDATLCVGCKACVRACKEINGLPPSIMGEDVQYDAARDVSGDTYNVIKVYKNGTSEAKDREIDGFSFAKKSCMHCVDPACVSACPVTALDKNPQTGIVQYNPDVCIGCRNCMVACPYNIPQYEYNDPRGQIQKCQFCNQAGVERISQGLLPGCAEVCPTGATLFGTRRELLEEAKRRLAAKPGETYTYARGRASDGLHTHDKEAPEYRQHVYGERELGGTQVMHIAGVPLNRLGLPELPERSYASIAEGVQHTLYKGMIAPAIALAGLAFVVKRNTSKADQDDPQSQNSRRPEPNNDRGES